MACGRRRTDCDGTSDHTTTPDAAAPSRATHQKTVSWPRILSSSKSPASAAPSPGERPVLSKPKPKPNSKLPTNTNDNTTERPRHLRRSSSWSVAAAATAASSAMGKPLLLGVRDLVTQWFVNKEAEQLMTGRRMQNAQVHEEEERQREEEARQADQGRAPPGQDLAVVWKPFMTLMMNRGEGPDEHADEDGRATNSHANGTSSTSSRRRTLHPHSAHTSLSPSSPSPCPSSPRLTPHLLTLIPLLLFVTSIETSLRLARLSAINDISSIGQLIPFIIGLASFAASCREVLLVVYRRRHPDWRDWAWEVRTGGVGGASARVLRPRREKRWDGERERRDLGGKEGVLAWWSALRRRGALSGGGGGGGGVRAAKGEKKRR